MKNNYIITVIVAVVVGGAGFFGGMKYQQSKTPAFGQFRANVNGQIGNGRMMAGNGTTRTGGNGFQPVSGEITSVDEKSMTVKLTDGGSKIVILSDSTKVNETQEVDKSKLAIGSQVSAFGTTNSDGSITAQSVQLNPKMNRPGGTSGE